MCGLRMRPVASSIERGPSNATSAAPTGRRAREVFQTGSGWPARLGRGSPHLPGRWVAGTIRPFVGACDHCACCLFCLPEVSVWSSPALYATSALGFYLSFSHRLNHEASRPQCTARRNLPPETWAGAGGGWNGAACLRRNQCGWERAARWNTANSKAERCHF